MKTLIPFTYPPIHLLLGAGKDFSDNSSSLVACSVVLSGRLITLFLKGCEWLALGKVWVGNADILLGYLGFLLP